MLLTYKFHLIGALILALAVVAPTVAHQQKESYTRVTVNPRTQQLEVMQRFYLHDAEHALNSVLGSKANLALDKSAQANFASYVAQSFGLLDAQQKNIVLQFVGFEVEGKYLWVYHEGTPPNDLTQLSVRMSTLQDVWSEQINHINFEFGVVKSVRLGAQDTWVTVRF